MHHLQTRILPVSLPRRSGFSRIDLLIIAAIILVLGVILVPRFARRDSPLVNDVRAQLRIVQEREADFHRTHGAYTTDRAALGLTDSAMVTVTIDSASATGWSATATHRSAPVTCSLWVGSARLDRGQEGEPECR